MLHLNKTMSHLLVLLVAVSARGDLARDAGKAAAGDEKALAVEVAVQLERSGDETERALELALQYAPPWLPRASIVLEALPRVWYRESDSPSIAGEGDTEVTLYWLAFAADGLVPGVLLGGKLTLPTDHRRGSFERRADMSGLLAVGSELDELELNLELEFMVPGQTTAAARGVERRRKQLTTTVSIDYGLLEHLSLVAEWSAETRETASADFEQVLSGGIELDIDLLEDATLFLETGFDTEALFGLKLGLEVEW